MSLNVTKRIVCLVSVIMLAGIRAYAESYFLDRSDVTLEYVRSEAGDGKFTWRHAVNVIDVKDTGTHIKYTTESFFTKENGKPLYRSVVTETAIVDKLSGDVSLDVGGVMASYIKARTGLNASSTGKHSILPAAMEPGDTLAPVVAHAKVGPLTYKLVVSERKVLRRETITVPAGTFDCIVVSENKLETGPGHNRYVTNVTWYSKGVGYVRHDTYIKGKLDTSEILNSIR